jgi:lipoprotein
MNLYKILGALILALSFIFTSCDWVSNEPTIEGDHFKYFDSSAQRKSFRVVNASGKRYNHKVDWHIIGITQLDSDTFFTKKVDTPP